MNREEQIEQDAFLDKNSFVDDNYYAFKRAVEWADEIDVEHAKRSEEDAREKIKIHKSGVEFDRAQLKLKRALNRLSVSKNR